MKGTKKILAVVLIMCLFLGGCGRQTGADLGENSATTQQESVTGTGGDTAGEAVPDGEYVYDYQVSQEPIPKEIADLGGPCQGTIHAFPSRIEIGLTQKKMEEDPVFKAEVEKRIPEVEAALEEHFGGKFRVDEVDALDDFTWRFYCTEEETGYQFGMTYINKQYAFSDKNKENDICFEDYYDLKETEELREDISGMIQDTFGDCISTVWVQVMTLGVANYVNVHIIQCTDEEIDRQAEEQKMLSLWDKLEGYSDELDYSTSMLYYPDEYKEVMEQKYLYGEFYDFEISYYKELLKDGELKERLWCGDTNIEEIQWSSY